MLLESFSDFTLSFLGFECHLLLFIILGTVNLDVFYYLKTSKIKISDLSSNESAMVSDLKRHLLIFVASGVVHTKSFFDNFELFKEQSKQVDALYMKTSHSLLSCLVEASCKWLARVFVAVVVLIVVSLHFKEQFNQPMQLLNAITVFVILLILRLESASYGLLGVLHEELQEHVPFTYNLSWIFLLVVSFSVLLTVL